MRRAPAGPPDGRHHWGRSHSIQDRASATATVAVRVHGCGQRRVVLPRVAGVSGPACHALPTYPCYGVRGSVPGAHVVVRRASGVARHSVRASDLAVAEASGGGGGWGGSVYSCGGDDGDRSAHIQSRDDRESKWRMNRTWAWVGLSDMLNSTRACDLHLHIDAGISEQLGSRIAIGRESDTRAVIGGRASAFTTVDGDWLGREARSNAVES